MENKIYHLSSAEMKERKKSLEIDESLFLIEIDGKTIHTRAEYLAIVSKLCRFPISSCNFDSYEDWMTDLSWLKKDAYAIIIYNFSHFLDQDTESKGFVMEGFSELLLPWWEGDVEKHVVDGKAKPFNVYLVE